MKTSIPMRDLSFGSLFKICFWTSVFPWFIFFILSQVITRNSLVSTGSPAYLGGFFIGALLSPILLAVIFSLIGATAVHLFGKVVSFGSVKITDHSIDVFSD